MERFRSGMGRVGGMAAVVSLVLLVVVVRSLASSDHEGGDSSIPAASSHYDGSKAASRIKAVVIQEDQSPIIDGYRSQRKPGRSVQVGFSREAA